MNELLPHTCVPCPGRGRAAALRQHVREEGPRAKRVAWPPPRGRAVAALDNVSLC